jgi:hypothetical protein
MFWTAFVWGVGCSCGAAFGLLLAVMLFDVWRKIIKVREFKRSLELAELANEALFRRNELTEKQIDILGSMASIMMKNSVE